jgi:hypothetical protein
MYFVYINILNTTITTMQTAKTMINPPCTSTSESIYQSPFVKIGVCDVFHYRKILTSITFPYVHYTT